MEQKTSVFTEAFRQGLLVVGAGVEVKGSWKF